MSKADDETPMVTFTIDGTAVTVPKGTLIIRAAEQLGTVIPRFCDHPLLDPVGACRQCVVEVEGQRKPMMACTTEAADGWEVRTHVTSEVAATAQEGTLEFLLVNHPLDCPMCDKGGECPLQDQALEHGSNISRFVDEKRRYDKPVAVSPLVLLDRERCVLCARCTRFSEQISGDPFIELFERGALEQVAIYEDEPYHSAYSGNVIQICPVGALTSSDYRFKARPFDITSQPSVCGDCAGGCNTTVQARRNEVNRVLARTNMDVNEMWLCDKGRFSFPVLNEPSRLTAPLLRTDGAAPLATTSWSTALVTAADRLADADGRVGVVVGNRLPDEDAHALSKYARRVLGTDDVTTVSAPVGATPGATSRDAAALAHLAGRALATHDDVEHADTVVVVGCDLRERSPMLFLRLRKGWRNNGTKVVTVGPRMGSLTEYAWRWVPTGAGREAAGVAALAAAAGVGDAPDVAGIDPAITRDVVETAKDGASVVLVGQEAGVDALVAGIHLADALGAKVAWVPDHAGTMGAIRAGLAPGLLPGGRVRPGPAAEAATSGDHDATETRPADPAFDAIVAAWGDTGLDLDAPHGRGLAALLQACVDGEVTALHLVGVDLLTEAPDPALARRAIDAVDVVVVQDLTDSATARLADVVLPTAGSLERSGSYTNWEGRQQRFQQTVDAPGAVQQDWEVLVQISALLGHDLGFDDLEGLRLEAKRIGTHAAELPGFPSGLDDARVARADDDSLEVTSGPLLLGSDRHLAGADHLLATALEPAAALHPVDADRLGLSDGETVAVAAPGSDERDATLELTVSHARDVVPGTVWLPTNAGRPLGDIAVANGAPARVILSSGTDGAGSAPDGADADTAAEANA